MPAFYMSRVLSELPFFWVLPLVFFVVLYPMVWLPPYNAAVLFGVTMLNVEGERQCACHA